jgi:hypothetical protein
LPRKHKARIPLGLSLLFLLVISLPSLRFPAHAAALPDLTVDSVWLEESSAPGQPVTAVAPGDQFLIVASIRNIGDATASGYYLDVYYDSDYGRGGPDNIAPGEAQTWYVGPLTAQAGTHTTKWVVDPDNQIAELDETNNEKEFAFTVGSQTVTATVTSGSTSSTAGSTSTSTLTVTSIVRSIQFLTSILTATVTSYTGTQASTSTIVVPTTVTIGPSTSTQMVQTTQVLTSTGTTTVTGYTTTTLTSYTGTQTSTSMVVVPTTVTLGPSTMTTTVQTTQVLTSTGTATATGYTTTTVSSYTATTTSTGTSVVYTTVTKSGAGAAGASSPVAYLGFISLLAVTVGRRVTARRGWKIPRPRSRSRMQRRCSSS